MDDNPQTKTAPTQIAARQITVHTHTRDATNRRETNTGKPHRQIHR